MENIQGAKDTKIKRALKDKNNPYVIINKKPLENPNLSWEAKGLLAYILSLPDDWDLYISHLVKQSRNKETSVRTIINELIDNNYIQRYPVYVNGKVSTWEYEVSEWGYDDSEKIKCIKIDATGQNHITLYTKDEINNIRKSRIEKKKKESERVKKYYKSSPNDAASNKNLLPVLQEVEKNKNLLPVIQEIVILDEVIEGQLNNNTTNINSTEKLLVVDVVATNLEQLKTEFEENICPLKKTTSKKFINYAVNLDFEFVKCVIDYCAEINTRSFEGFRVAIDSFVSKGINTKEKLTSYVYEYRTKKKENREKNKKTNRSGNFNNFEQRTYDFDGFEKEYFGWNKE